MDLGETVNLNVGMVVVFGFGGCGAVFFALRRKGFFFGGLGGCGVVTESQVALAAGESQERTAGGESQVFGVAGMAQVRSAF